MSTKKMSIDAVIEDVQQTQDGYVLTLGPRSYTREDGSVGVSIPGQEKLTLLDPSWRPEKGMAVWGGSGSVFIVVRDNGYPAPECEYTREGYTTIRESRWVAES
jgi:hypothetical protein